MKIGLPVYYCVFACLGMVIAAPLVSSGSRIILVPASAFQNSLYAQTRGPFDFIGNWIQSSNVLPIEINVPDAFQAVGNGVGTAASNIQGFAQGVGSNIQGFAQGVGSNIQGFAQGVGSNIQSFAQSLGQRVPILGAIFRPTQTGQKQFFIVVADGQNGKRYTGSTKDSSVMMMNDLESEIFDSFP